MKLFTRFAFTDVPLAMTFSFVFRLHPKLALYVKGKTLYFFARAWLSAGN